MNLNIKQLNIYIDSIPTKVCNTLFQAMTTERAAPSLPAALDAKVKLSFH